MFDYIPAVFKGQYAETEAEADQWLRTTTRAAAPDLLPRDEVARAINSEVKAGRGSPHGGVYLDIATRLTPEEIKRRLPSMYHQFMELARSTSQDEMEVGPDLPLRHGRHRGRSGHRAVGRDLGTVRRRGVLGRHARLQPPGGNSLSDLLVFGRRAGLGASRYVRALRERPAVAEAAVEEAAAIALTPFNGPRATPRAVGPYARRTAADDERPRRHHPHRAEMHGGPRQDRGVQGARPQRRVRAAASSTRLASGLDIRTCCWSASASRSRRWRDRAAGEPATTPRRWTPTGAIRWWRRRRRPGEPEVRQAPERAGVRREDLAELPAELEELIGKYHRRGWRTRDGRAGELQGEPPGLARRRRGRRTCRTTCRGERGRGRPRHHPSACRPSRRPTSRCGGTARPASAARARRRSTAVRG